jgi:CRISPR system Cascade subunit CasC
VLVYYSPEEIDLLSQPVMESEVWQTILQELSQGASPTVAKIVTDIAGNTKKRATAPDIALFGRMLADRPETNVDAACQVAHAISTHRVSMDIDFFTAVDDLQPGGETGAGMMGVTGFNSATFYRYARLDWDQLVKNLYGQTDTARQGVEGFLRAAVDAIPTGKQNSFAAHNPPSFLLGVARPRGMGWSLANAFERPVSGGMSGLVGPSVEALDAYWGRLAQVYGFEGSAAALALDETIQLEALADYVVADFSTWIDTLMAALPQE